MPITISNKPQLTGIVILFTGVALLAFTFINAFLFLQEPFSIIATGDLARVFGEALAPLIQACIRLMYLGIMGWIGSLLTVRGIPLVTYKYVPVAPPITTTQAKQQPQPQPIKQPQPKPTPTPTTRPQPTPQQPKVVPSPQPTSESKQEEPKAVLITPENQKEE
jgi:hypothetical protein